MKFSALFHLRPIMVFASSICCICIPLVSSVSFHSLLVRRLDDTEDVYSAFHFNGPSISPSSQEVPLILDSDPSSSGPWVQVGSTIYGRQYRDDQSSTISSFTGERFGWSVATSKVGPLTIIVGTPFGIASGSFLGNARVFRLNEDTKVWAQIGGDIEGREKFDHTGWSVDINGDGEVVVIGAPDNDVNDYGHAQIYRNIDGTWEQMGQDLKGVEVDEKFGQSVAISFDGRRVIIGGGASYTTSDSRFSGHARIYEYNDTARIWVQIGADIKGKNVDDRFGYSVDMNGDGYVVIIGAPSNNDQSFNAGHARIYQDIDGQWIQWGQDLTGKRANNNFGSSVAISLDGNRVIIGAPFNYRKPGYAEVYEFTEKDNALRWVQMGNDIEGEEDYDEFGSSVDMNGAGDIVVIGAPSNSDDHENGGHARVYQYLEGKWIQKGQDLDGTSSYNEFGFSVAISIDGDKVIAGGPSNYNDIGSQIGHVRAFEFDENFHYPQEPSVYRGTAPTGKILAICAGVIVLFIILFLLRKKIISRSTKEANTETAVYDRVEEGGRAQEDDHELGEGGGGTTSNVDPIPVPVPVPVPVPSPFPVPLPVAQEIKHGDDFTHVPVAQVMGSHTTAATTTTYPNINQEETTTSNHDVAIPSSLPAPIPPLPPPLPLPTFVEPSAPPL